MPETLGPSPEEMGLNKKPSVDEQLNKKESMPVLDGKVEFTEVIPEKTRTEVPIMLAPGWGGDIASAFKETMREFAEQERSSIAMEHPHSVGEVPESMPDKVKQRPIEEVRKAAAMVEFLNQKGIDKVDAFTHSEGSVYTVLAAAAAPEKFRSIVVSNPAGMIGGDNLVEFAKRSLKGAGKKGEPFPGTKLEQAKADPLKGEGMWGFLLHMPKKAYKDMKALTNSDVHSLLKDLHDKGIKIAVMAGVDDNMFPAKKLATDLKKYENELDGFLSIKGGHTEVLDHPHAYAKHVESLFKSLEKKPEAELA